MCTDGRYRRGCGGRTRGIHAVDFGSRAQSPFSCAMRPPSSGSGGVQFSRCQMHRRKPRRAYRHSPPKILRTGSWSPESSLAYRVRNRSNLRDQTRPSAPCRETYWIEYTGRCCAGRNGPIQEQQRDEGGAIRKPFPEIDEPRPHSKRIAKSASRDGDGANLSVKLIKRQANAIAPMLI